LGSGLHAWCGSWALSHELQANSQFQALIQTHSKLTNNYVIEGFQQLCPWGIGQEQFSTQAQKKAPVVSANEPSATDTHPIIKDVPFIHKAHYIQDACNHVQDVFLMISPVLRNPTVFKCILISTWSLNMVANSAMRKETLALPENAHDWQSSAVFVLYPTYRFLLQIMVLVIAHTITHVHGGIEPKGIGVCEHDDVENIKKTYQVLNDGYGAGNNNTRVVKVM
jgi:hypothetical protein